MTIYENADRALLPGFERMTVSLPDGDVRTLVGGDGPPVLMLHGDPQTHLCWRKIAPALAQDFTVVLTDLRGRGETHKPGCDADHAPYSKRAMAAEQAAVMERLGFPRFSLVGHDRGARLARRLALDLPERVRSLAVMDIVPALDFYERADSAVAQDYFYFFFLTQAHPLPERLIAGDARAFMAQILTGLSSDAPPVFEADALEVYLRASTSEEAIRAMCECFRAGYGIDRAHDAEDRDAGRVIACPTLVFWGEQGVVGRHFDVPSIWRRWAPDARFAPLPCGHFIPEEAPDATLAHLRELLSETRQA